MGRLWCVFIDMWGWKTNSDKRLHWKQTMLGKVNKHTKLYRGNVDVVELVEFMVNQQLRVKTPSTR